MTEADTLSNVVHSRDAKSTERVEREPHLITPHREAGQPCQQCSFKDTKLVDGTGRGPESLAQFAARSPQSVSRST